MRTHRFLLPIPLVLLAAACGGPDAAPAVASSAALTQSATNGGVQVTLTTSGPLVQGVPNTYTWTATNVSAGTLLVSMGSNWTDADRGAPVIKALAPGCGNQSANEVPPNDALGIWCGSASLAPGASLSVWATLQDDAAGPVRYNPYSLHADPLTGSPVFTVVADTERAAPGPVDLQISGSSNQGAPRVNSTYTYTYQIKNAGPWATSGGVTFSDALPASLAFVGVTASAGSCAGGQTVSCSLGDLANGAQATVAVTVRAPATAQQIANTASASLAVQADTNASNNSLTVTVASK
ncbi:MAG TPA: DUF11 domain-containing protein [Myxococcales bacterium]|nr:DUF11 domain-containing protein [Myxococcales bacterium]